MSQRPYDAEELPPDVAKDHPLAEETERSSISSSEVQQAGVKKTEAITLTWSKWALVMAYVGVFLLAQVTSLEGQTTFNFTPYATSTFAAHSLVSTVLVVQSVVRSVIKPPMAKIADVFGRFEALTISIFVYVIGYIMMAASNNVRTYAGAQIFYSAGFTGVQILIQIFVADTTDLLNRALFSTLPDTPFLWNTWIGSPIAANFLPNRWRWGYGLWAIVLPAAFLPLALSLLLNQMKAKKKGYLAPSPFRGQGPLAVARSLWFELDLFGLILLAAAICLILLPLTLAPQAKGGWTNASMIAMIVIGFVCLVVVPFWERSKKLAPYAFFPPQLFQSRTVLAGLGISFFYFMAFYLSVQPYFYSYLLVVQNQSVVTAGYITQTFSFTSTVASVIISIIIKYTGHYKYFVTAGACIYMLGMGLLIAYRTEGASVSTLVGCQIAIGIGGGMLNVPAQLGVQAASRHQNVAAATAVFLTVLEIGGAVGSAISGAVWSSNVLAKLQAYLPAEAQDQASLIFANVTLAQTGWPMGSPERNAINRAYQETIHTLLIIAVCVTAPIIILSLFMTNYKLGHMDQKVLGKVIGSDRRDSVADGTPAGEGTSRWRRMLGKKGGN